MNLFQSVNFPIIMTRSNFHPLGLKTTRKLLGWVHQLIKLSHRKLVNCLISETHQARVASHRCDDEEKNPHHQYSGTLICTAHVFRKLDSYNLQGKVSRINLLTKTKQSNLVSRTTQGKSKFGWDIALLSFNGCCFESQRQASPCGDVSTNSQQSLTWELCLPRKLWEKSF